ncbi:MAG TPA: hypothetical protein VFP54_07535 [Acidimicrobiales bacterium]|nr:hypothetical protein [Acidimicrobiales bacterium]
MALIVLLALIVVFVVLPVVGWALWTIVSAIVVGLVVGALGRLVVPGTQPIGFLATVVAGLVGSIAGNAIGHGIGAAHFATVLLEVASAAVVVAVLSTRRSLPPGRRRSLPY